jgi:glycosyltransferase involved in cell wall biosynthesis
VPFEVLGLDPGWRRPFDLLSIRQYLERVRPTIVHTFLLTASLYGRLAAMLARVPVVIGTEVNVYANKRKRHVVAEQWLLRGTDAVIVSAASVRDFYIDQVHADPSKIEVIYNAVDWSQLQTTLDRPAMRSALGLSEDVPLIGIIARLTEQKAHKVLFDALAETQGLAAAHLLVIGDGELRPDLEARAASLRIDSRVHFLGARRDLGNLLSAMDVFVMPSFWEGLPLSMVLAMGAALPVVATSVAGIPEVVQHGRTGLLVPPGDSHALGDALTRVVASPELRHDLGTSAREYVLPRFGSTGYVDAVTAVYDRLLAAKGLA